MGVYIQEHVHAPDFPPDRIWLNSPPLTLAHLRGKIVLIDFWDYTCINCIRTLPYLNEWHRRYARYGLAVIGVHTPEFAFAKEKRNVAAAVDKFGVGYPVLLDNDSLVWTLYANTVWPREYLIDRAGYIVYDHAGEGGYRRTELLIQKYLREMYPEARFPEPYSAPGTVRSDACCYRVTPELHLGYARGVIGNAEGYRQDETVHYRDTGSHMDSLIYLNGPWVCRSESLKHARRDAGREDYIALDYHAMSVNAVIGSADGRFYRVYVTQDGKPVDPADRGEDLAAAPDGRTFLEVRESRMYHVIRNREFGEHDVRFASESEDFDVYAFTFGPCKT